MDSLFEDAAEVIVNHQQGSASLLQRKLKLGITEQEELLINSKLQDLLGPIEEVKLEVLIPDVLALEQFLNNLREKGKYEN